jgi:hypothetical protein
VVGRVKRRFEEEEEQDGCVHSNINVYYNWSTGITACSPIPIYTPWDLLPAIVVVVGLFPLVDNGISQ